MSLKLKSVVLFFKILTCFLLPRPFSYKYNLLIAGTRARPIWYPFMTIYVQEDSRQRCRWGERTLKPPSWILKEEEDWGE